MKRKMKRFLGILLSLALVLGLIPGMSLTAYADSEPSVAVSPANSGTVSIESYTSSSGYPAYHLTPQPADGYTFKKWTYKSGGNTLESTYNPWNVMSTQLPYISEITAVFESSHTHSFTYSASGAIITVTCTADGCDLPPSTTGGTDHVAKLSLVAPTLTTYGETGKSASATLDGVADFNTATGKTIATTDIKYVGRDGTTYAESATAPTDAGKYTAKITVEENTASLNYEIAKADPTANAPTGMTAQYGQTLSDVTLTNPAGNTDGTWAWADSTKSVGNVVSPAATFKATFTPISSNYKTVENVDVTVTVCKANAVAATVTANSRTYDGTEKPLVTVTGEPTGGEMQYALGTATEATQPYTTSIPAKTEAGTYYVWYKVVGDANHNDTTPACVEVKINPVDKTDLNNAITEAETYYNTIKDETVYDDIANALKSAIDTAKSIAGNDNVVESVVTDSLDAVSQAETDAEAVKAVIDMITALPAIDQIKVSDAKQITEAREACDALTADQKAKIPNASQKKLNATVAVLEAKEAQEAAEEAKAAAEAAEAQAKKDQAAAEAAAAQAKKDQAVAEAAAAKAGAEAKAAKEAQAKAEAAKKKAEAAKAKALAEKAAAEKAKAKAEAAKKKAEAKAAKAKKATLQAIAKGVLVSAKGGKGKISVKWKALKGAKAYRVLISKNKKGTVGAKVYNINSTKKLSTVLKKIKKGTYYVRVRGFKYYKGNSVCGKYSFAKVVKVK